MATFNPYQKYQTLAVNTLTSGELIVLLYDEMTLRMNKAILCIRQKQFSDAHNHIVRAEKIISYLVETLDMRYPISKNLNKLYDYINRELIRANINKDIAILEELIPMVTDLKDTWKQADLITRQKTNYIGGAV